MWKHLLKNIQNLPFYNLQNVVHVLQGIKFSKDKTVLCAILIVYAFITVFQITNEEEEMSFLTMTRNYINSNDNDLMYLLCTKIL